MDTGTQRWKDDGKSMGSGHERNEENAGGGFLQMRLRSGHNSNLLQKFTGISKGKAF